WALAIQAALAAEHGVEPQVVYGDDGIVLRLPEAQELELPLHRLVPDADEVEDLIVAQLASTPLFAGLFRENAARALLLPRRRPGNRTPLWLQRRRAAELLAVAREHPSFPIVLETYRSCLRDVFDLGALRELLGAVARREVVVHAVDTPAASPFARGLVFAYVASNLYQGDAPLAERRAQALTLDRELLRELLGEAALRDLLDPELIAEVEAELQGLHPSRRCRDVDGVHDLLRRVGDLSPSGLAARCEGDHQPWLAELEQAKRATRLTLAGEARVVAVEDVALYRDALGVAPPPGLPAALLESVTSGIAILCERYARTHGPFRADELAQRYGLTDTEVEQALQPLANRSVLVRGALRPGGTSEEYCDAEVLRRIKRRTLARLRADAQALPAATLARFLPAWHAIDTGGQGLARLRQAIVQLEGLALPVSELESAILPARVRDFSPAMLDELGATGFLCFVGRGALGSHDGKVALYRRSHVAALLEPAKTPDQLGPVAAALLSELERRGARFFAELAAACAPATMEQVLDGLHGLLWAGLVTNDTFAPLRSLARPRTKSARVHARAVARAAAGRWSTCADLVREPPAPTVRAHARCVSLLERHGLLTPEAATLEDLPGGFAALYPVLKAMEEAGKIRRGYFVEGLGGAQFAYAGAVERLRSVAAGSERDALLLSAVDPANPFGWLLPWPDAPEPGDGGADDANRGQRARRVAGASVVIVDREPVLYLGAGGKHLTTFPAASDSHKLEAAIPKLRELARRNRAKRLRIEQIDGAQPRASALTPHLLASAFVQGYRGLELDAR
ncbi:MAG: DNA glycosylase AlkZ-like family protein, partial [Polyangiales bacterium]